jgi:hypothetical protein
MTNIKTSIGVPYINSVNTSLSALKYPILLIDNTYKTNPKIILPAKEIILTRIVLKKPFMINDLYGANVDSSNVLFDTITVNATIKTKVAIAPA